LTLPRGRRYIALRSERPEGREERPDEELDPDDGGDTGRWDRHRGTGRAERPRGHLAGKDPRAGEGREARAGSPMGTIARSRPSGVRRLRARTGREVGPRTTGPLDSRKVDRPEPQRRRRWHGRREAHRSPAVRILSARQERRPGH
jgi:hypothetical protein